MYPIQRSADKVDRLGYRDWKALSKQGIFSKTIMCVSVPAETSPSQLHTVVSSESPQPVTNGVASAALRHQNAKLQGPLDLRRFMLSQPVPCGQCCPDLLQAQDGAWSPDAQPQLWQPLDSSEAHAATSLFWAVVFE